MMNDTLHIIAEAGTNHNADPATARELIDVAIAAGADSVKFQVIYPEGLYLPRTLEDGVYKDNEVFEIRRAGMLSDDDYSELATFCREKEIPMSASVFDRRGLDLLDEIDAPYIKLASSDLNNSDLLKAAAERGRKMIISTGMASLGEVERAVKDILSTGNRDLVLMHCVSAYPCPAADTNLGFIKTLDAAFGFPLGYSDHTQSSVAGAIAVSMGVTWLEKHFTLDCNAEGFDHIYAMEPEPLKSYIADMRSAAAACCRPHEKVRGTEATVKPRARRGLYAARDIASGETLTQDDILIVRPEGPLLPNQAELILGRTVRADIRQYEALALDQF